MAFDPNNIGATINPIASAAGAGFVVFLKYFLIMIAVGYVLMVWRYNVKVTIREYIKGGKTIVYSVRAREILDRKSKIPKIKFFHPLIFIGHEINQPPGECIVPYRGVMQKKMYDFIKKDGLYYPVQNLVLGRRYDIPMVASNEKELYNLEAANDEIDQILRKYDLVTNEEERSVYSIHGSGLEISRDYDAEQAIENALISKAETYRNQKPSFMYAIYGLAIILAIGSFSMGIYTIHQMGGLSSAIASLREPLQQGVQGAIQQKLGP